MRFGGEEGPLDAIELFRSPKEVFELRSGSVSRSALTFMTVPESVHCLLWVCRGTVLVRKDTDARWCVLAPKSVGFLSGPADVSMNVARGDHQLYVMGWEADGAASLHRWIEFQNRANMAARARSSIRSKPFTKVDAGDLDRLAEDAKGGADWIIPVMYSYAHCAVAECLKGNDELGLTPLPVDLPPVIVALIDRVKSSPESPWPLKDAAEFVGYSPFHFSRVFKGLVSYGFHEFVDRCRTEMAVKMLTTSEDPVEVIASASGFGTAQSLRESVKEHLGLLPSELRASTEEPN